MSESTQFLIDPALATPMVVVIAVGLGIVWCLAHRFKSLVSAWSLRGFFFACRVCLGAVAIWVGASLAARFFTLGFVLPLWLIALLGAAVIELVIMISAYERGMMGARSKLVLATRLAAALCLVVALLEPLAVDTTTRRWQREVAVIVDDSASMQIIDERAAPGYALEVAALFGLEIASERPRLNKIADQLRAASDSLQRGANGFFAEDQLGRIAAEVRSIPVQLDEQMPELRELLLRQVDEIRRAQRAGDAPAIDRAGEAIDGAISAALVKLGRAQQVAETEFLTRLTGEQRYQIVESSKRPRAEIARELLSKVAGPDGRDLITAIGKKYKLGFYFAGAGLVPADPQHWVAGAETGKEFRNATALGGALDAVLRAVPPQLLAGAVVATDGANNSGIDLDGPARGFALRGAPIGGVTLGGSAGSGAIDAAITGVYAPRKLVIGEELTIEADLNFQNMAGRSAEVVLSEDGIEIERKGVQVRDADQRVSVIFEHHPDLIGMKEYELKVEADGTEQVVANNVDAARVRVMEEDEVDALDVLLVDSHPRWEFRYLRNLFDGRDESVRLQHVLFRPEAISGVAPLPPVAASSARPFGESRASDLPTTPAEWSAFEVIILGDVSPDSISPEQWAIIEESVDKSGAMLVLVAGKKSMPHQFRDENFAALAPASYEAGVASPSAGEMFPYAIRWTPAGHESRLNEVSSDSQTTRDFWNAIPPINWRHPVAKIKPGAEVLAYAQRLFGDDRAVDPDELAKRNALIVTHRYGKGRVVAMNFDRTYRMRFGFGERYHHRFWWQLIHWSAAEEFDLDSLVELKIDREHYAFGAPVEVIAKAIDTEDEPLAGPLSVKVFDDNGAELLRQTLVPRAAGHGVFETTLHDLPAEGKYEVILEGEGIAELLSADKPKSVSANFTVDPVNPVELRDLSAHPGVLGYLARRTGGKVVSLGDAPSLVDLFGESHVTETSSTEKFLWDRPLFLLIFVVLVAAEWILRRQAGLP